MKDGYVEEDQSTPHPPSDNAAVGSTLRIPLLTKRFPTGWS